MYPVAMTIINPRKEYWPRRGSNQRSQVCNATNRNPNRHTEKKRKRESRKSTQEREPETGRIRTAQSDLGRYVLEMHYRSTSFSQRRLFVWLSQQVKSVFGFSDGID